MNNSINGNLAKKYVEFADLVIFVTSSGSPLKENEMNELRKLFGKKKRVLILINKSDEWIPDEVDGKLIKSLEPKTDKDRKTQEDYAKHQFETLGDGIYKELNAISLSIHLALQAIRTDNYDEFVSSGVPLFFEKLGEICSKEAVQLKMEAPKQRINAVLKEIIEGGNIGENQIAGIKQYEQYLTECERRLEKAKQEMKNVAHNSLPKIQNEVSNQARSCVHDAVSAVGNGSENVELDGQINKIVTDVVTHHLQEGLRSVITDYNSGMFEQKKYKKSKGIHIAAKTESVERTEFKVVEEPRDPEGLIEHLQSIFWDKKFKRYDVESRKVVEKFSSGDNAAEMMDELKNMLNGTTEQYVMEYMDNVTEKYFGEEEKILQNIKDKLASLKSTLEGEILE